MTTPNPGITVATTTETTYTVASGASFTYDVGPTGELAVSVLGAQDNELAAFGNVEAVYVTGQVQVTAAPPAASRGLL